MSESLLGHITNCVVIRFDDTGYVLEKNDTEIHLHQDEATEELNEGDTVCVFIYEGKRDQLTASLKIPQITHNFYGFATVVESIPNLGVFVDIGTTKEILVSMDDLPYLDEVWPIEGDLLYVKLGTDRRGKLLAIPATEGVIDDIRKLASDDLLNKNVQGSVYLTDREGSAVLTDEGYRGFIHYTERKDEPRMGEQVDARVIDVKEDGTINLSLRPLKQFGMQEDAEVILDYILSQDGEIPFYDKSDPEDIRETFQISKSAFKRALGKLMKDGKVKQEEGKTYSINE